MSSASKRVRRFLKARSSISDTVEVIKPRKDSKDYLTLYASDVQEVLDEKKYWKDRAERAESKPTIEAPSVDNRDAVAVLQDLLNRSNSIEDVQLPRQLAWQLLRRAKSSSTEEMLRKHLLQYGEMEKAVREALRLVPTYRSQNPEYNREQTERITAARLVNLSPSAEDIEFAPEN